MKGKFFSISSLCVCLSLSLSLLICSRSGRCFCLVILCDILILALFRPSVAFCGAVGWRRVILSLRTQSFFGGRLCFVLPLSLSLSLSLSHTHTHIHTHKHIIHPRSDLHFWWKIIIRMTFLISVVLDTMFRLCTFFRCQVLFGCPCEIISWFLRYFVYAIPSFLFFFCEVVCYFFPAMPFFIGSVILSPSDRCLWGGISYLRCYVLLGECISSLPDIGLGVRVFANRPGDLGSIPGRVIPKTQKMVLDASLLNTQHYKVRIKGKVEQSREGVAPPLHLGVVAIEKGAFGLPSTMVANFTISSFRCLFFWTTTFSFHRLIQISHLRSPSNSNTSPTFIAAWPLYWMISSRAILESFKSNIRWFGIHYNVKFLPSLIHGRYFTKTSICNNIDFVWLGFMAHQP